jgi:hypothetical protein
MDSVFKSATTVSIESHILISFNAELCLNLKVFLNNLTIIDPIILAKMLVIILCIKFNTAMFPARAHALRQAKWKA